MLLASEATSCDVAVVCLGVNDTKNGVSAGEWKRSYAAVFAELRARGASQIIACGLPPLGTFPLLPWPLRQTLGARADSLDRHLQALVEAEPTAVHVPSLFEMDPAMMASDGFHPGPVLYRLWGQGLADVIREQR
jgi:lysophospholipase L1-like esterase